MKFWVGGSIILILTIIGSGIFLAKIHSDHGLSAAEKQHALESLLGRSPVLQEAKKDTSLKTFTGQYMHLQYPGGARIYASSSNSAQDTFSFSIVSDHIIVSTGVFTTSNSLDEFGGVVLRHTKSDIYTEDKMIFEGLSCKTFLKTEDLVEQSIFCSKNNKVLSYVVTGPDKESVQTDFTSFLQLLTF